MNEFERQLYKNGARLERDEANVLQLNVGRLCNLTCTHCHVGAGPRRKEIITRETLDSILDWFEQTSIPVLDLTGGTPEMIPDFQYLVKRVRQFEKPRHIIDRLNATIIHEPGYEWVTQFLADNEIEIIASMPCYEPANVEAQRGHGVFDKSISAFQLLNELGYGKDDDRRKLNFVYNPNGDFLPPNEKELESEYRVAMRDNFGIEFNDLYALANLPVTRFATWLKRNNKYEDYMQLLKDAFNAGTVAGLMCRNTINVGWQGRVYDCDFNQMMNMELNDELGQALYVWDINLDYLKTLPIRTASHCFGCTAGCGSSCGGSLLND